MSQDMKSYKQIITSLLEEICADEMESIQRAAQVMGDSIMRGQVIHVIGPGGHSNMAVEEMFSRAGGLACINAILDPGTNLSHGGFRSMKVERVPGYAKAVLESYGVGKTPGEVLLIINAYGINSMTIDCALEAKCYSPQKGVRVTEMSRLISRIRYRQFGIMITTSYVDTQAYSEVVEDGHPILIVTASDIANVLRKNALNSSNVEEWLWSIDSEDTKRRLLAYSKKYSEIIRKG